MAKGFSIIVCCYNSAALLPETLSRLSKLIVPAEMAVELIVVDNCSTDQTASAAGVLWQTYGQPFPLEIVSENKPGLSYARMRGIAASRYDFMLFCDDDNWLDPGYLTAAVPLLEKHPGVGMLGGLGLPRYQSIPSYWSSDFYIYGSGPQASVNGPVKTLHGAGVILRRQTMARLISAGFSFMLSDRKGDSLASGGDFELCLAVTMAGYQLWYSDTLTFSHFIGPERLTHAYSKRFIKESAPAINVLDVYHHVLAGGKYPKISFLLKQAKFMAHHSRRMLYAAWLSYKYRDNEKIVFLERFHFRYHLRRLECIPENLLAYGKIMRRITRVKAQLEERPVPAT